MLTQQILLSAQWWETVPALGSVTDLRDHKWGKHELHPNDRDECYYERGSKLSFAKVQLETNFQDNYIKHWKLD